MGTRVLKVKENEHLFNKWKAVAKGFESAARMIEGTCAPIAQNDMEIELSDLVEWKEWTKNFNEEILKLLTAFNNLFEESIIYVQQCNE